MKRVLFLLSVLFIAVAPLFAQSPAVLWTARYDGPGHGTDQPNEIISATNGADVFITGRSDGDASEGDIVLLKYNSTGIEQWVARYNGTGNEFDQASALTLDAVGNIYVTGESWGGDGHDFDVVTIKYNSTGIEQWVARYDGPRHEQEGGRSIAVDTAGNVYVAGISEGLTIVRDDFDYLILKYGPDGVEKWVTRYNGPASLDDFANSLALDEVGNIYVTGYSAGGGGDNDFVTLQYNESGEQQWTARYNGLSMLDDRSQAVRLTVGGIIVAGYSVRDAGYDFVVLKYNTAGVKQWEASYNGPGNDEDLLYDIDLDGAGNIYVTGLSIGAGGTDDYATVKYNSSGTQQWVTRYDSPEKGRDRPFAIKVGGSGVFVAGSTQGPTIPPVPLSDFLTVRYDATTGTQQWVARYDGSAHGTDIVTDLVVVNDGVVVTGVSEVSFFDDDIVTIKYGLSAVSVAERQTESPTTFALYQNYPNPFNSSTMITFKLSSLPAKLEISDVNGKTIRSFLLSTLQGSVTWDGTDGYGRLVSTGAYTYRLIAGRGMTQSRKMILAR